MDIPELVQHVCYRIANTPLRPYPFPHLYVTDVFPPDYYAAIVARWPAKDLFISQAESGRSTPGRYPARSILSLAGDDALRIPDPFWHTFAAWLNGPAFEQLMLTVFRPVLARTRELSPTLQTVVDSMLVEDGTDYHIGPHTDSPRRLVSSLFYCPGNASMDHLGTSLYVPMAGEYNPGVSARHYPRHLFTRVATLPFVPNSLFAFAVGPRSFHGVEPVTEPGVKRRLLLHYVGLPDTGRRLGEPDA